MTRVEMLSSLSDEELLLSARSDSAAFGYFYDRNVDDILSFFERRTGCAHTSADLTAETFAEALRGLFRFKPSKGDARAWLFGIARHQLSHFLRRQEVSQRSLKRLGIGIRPIDTDNSDSLNRVEALVDSARLRKSLAGAWSQLPSGLAEAVMLRVGEELNFDEVGRRLGCTPGAARVRVSRGLNRLAQVIDA